MIIAISGKRGSGKDVMADYLVKEHGFTKRCFAEPVKNGVMEMFGFTNDEVYGESKNKVNDFWHVTPRKILQVVATDILRDRIGDYIPELQWVGNDIWVLNWEKWYLENKDKNIVVSDLRFENEILMLQKHKAILIRIERDGTENDSHKSENELNSFTFENKINNNSDFYKYYKSIDEFIYNI